MKKYFLRYLLFLFLVIGLTFLALFLSLRNNFGEVLNLISKTNVLFLVIIIALIILLMIFRAIANNALIKIYYKNFSLINSIRVDQAATLSRMVTPAGVGGHIIETTVYKKEKVSISDALSIIAMYSIVYQIALIIFNIIAIIDKRNVISEFGNVVVTFGSTSGLSISLWILVAIGFVFNVLVIGLIFLLSYSKLIFKLVNGPLIILGAKLKLIKDVQSSQEKLCVAVTNFRSNLSSLLKNYKNMLISFVFIVIYIGLSYSIPHLVGLSLYNDSVNANIWNSIMLSNIHQMVSCIVPLPGNSMLSELFFVKLFYSSSYSFYSSEEIARASLLLWRSLTFIFPLLISCIYTLISTIRRGNKSRKEIINNAIN